MHSIQNRYHRGLLTLSLFFLISVSSTNLTAQPLPSIQYQQAGRQHGFDLLHMKLDIRIDFDKGTVSGVTSHTVRSIANGLDQIVLDADSAVQIEGVKIGSRTLSYRHTGDSLILHLEAPLDSGKSATIDISFVTTDPEGGIYFVRREEGEVNGRDQVWTQGEGEDHHYWFPLYDYPNDLATSELIATIRDDWQLLSNGTLVNVSKPKHGMRTWHYRMDEPHATYLFMLAAGDYLVTRETALGVPLEYWTYPELPERVRPTFHHTPDILHFLDSITGVHYPWNKYAQVFIDEFMYGGMENTTATTLNDVALVDEIGRIDYNPDGLIAHELAHQWFGDLVTNASWEHLWLHESFATYLAALYIRSRYGEGVYEFDMYNNQNGAIQSDDDPGRSPIAGGKGYTPNIYGRGAAVLRMLENEIGSGPFWNGIRSYLNRHRHSNAITDDLKQALEEAAGRDLDWFFNQWIYGAGMPVIEVSKEVKQDSARLVLRQNQVIDSLTGYFRLPLRVELYRDLGDDWDQNVDITLFALEMDSTTVWTPWFPTDREYFTVVNPGGELLMQLQRGAIDVEESYDQLFAARHPVDRYLGGKDVIGFVERFRDSLDFDSRVGLAYGSLVAYEGDLRSRTAAETGYIREELIRLAGELNNPIARGIILKGLNDPDVDVRKEAVAQMVTLQSDSGVVLIGSTDRFVTVAGQVVASFVLNGSDRDRGGLVTEKGRADVLRAMLHDSSLAVQLEALDVLTKLNVGGLEADLRRLAHIEGRRESIANRWISIVGRGGYTEFLDRVVWYGLHSEHYRTRLAVTEALQNILVTNDDIRTILLTSLEDRSNELATAAGEAIRKRNDPELLAGVRDYLSGNPELEKERRELVESLLKN